MVNLKGLVSADNDVDFEETWTTISDSLREMHTKNASKLSFETIYRLAYRVVLKKKGDAFYKRIQQFERDWLGGEVRAGLQTLLVPSLVGDIQAAGGAANSTINEKRTAGERLLRGLKEAWEDHQLVMNMATDVFMYLVGQIFWTLLHQVLTKPRIVSTAMTLACPPFTPPPCFCSETAFYVLHSPKKTPLS